MPWEEVDINNEEPESIDDAVSGLPEGWDKTHLGLRTYTKDYALGVIVEIFVLEDYVADTYTINPTVKDSDSKKKLTEKTYTAKDKASMESFVMRLIRMYDEAFEKK